jgi:hypothetical protein
MEDSSPELAVFVSLDEAIECYEEAAYFVRNAPGESATDDLTVVTAAALFAVETTNADLAKAMANDGRATLMESEEWGHRTIIPSHNSN